MANDFDALLSDLGETVTLERCTNSEGAISGDVTPSYGSPEQLTVITGTFMQRWIWDKEGLIEQGDRRILAKTTDSVSKSDRVTIGSEKYIVHDVMRRSVSIGSTDFSCDVCILFKVE